MTRSEALEAMARGICLEQGDNPDMIGFDRHGQRETFKAYERWIASAQAALQALEEGGMVVVRKRDLQRIKANADSGLRDQRNGFPISALMGIQKVVDRLLGTYQGSSQDHAQSTTVAPPSGLAGPQSSGAEG